MHKLKNFIFGPGRLNRRQYSIIAIGSSFLYYIFNWTVAFIAVILFSPETSVVMSGVTAIILLFFIFFINLSYTIRRGSDFGLSPFFSIIFVAFSGACLFYSSNLFATVLFGGYSYGNFWSNTILTIYGLVSSVYIFYPGIKQINIYGELPVDTGSPKRISKYMWTGSWDN